MRPKRQSLDKVDSVVDISPLMSVSKGRKKNSISRVFGGVRGVVYRLSINEPVSGEELATAIEASPGGNYALARSISRCALSLVVECQIA